ncbi:MAG: hypothetical protein ACLFPQ_02115 [Candidatus Woesearchaeota archaeon]
MARKLDISKIVFVLILFFLIFSYGKVFFNNLSLDSIKDNILSGKVFGSDTGDSNYDSAGNSDNNYGNNPNNKSDDGRLRNYQKEIKPIDKIITDTKINSVIELESFESATYEETQEMQETFFDRSDIFNLIGTFDNNNDLPLYCRFNVTIILRGLSNTYHESLEIGNGTKKPFRILIELPHGDSDIDFAYLCTVSENRIIE